MHVSPMRKEKKGNTYFYFSLATRKINDKKNNGSTNKIKKVFINILIYVSI